MSRAPRKKKARNHKRRRTVKFNFAPRHDDDDPRGIEALKDALRGLIDEQSQSKNASDAERSEPSNDNAPTRRIKNEQVETEAKARITNALDADDERIRKQNVSQGRPRIRRHRNPQKRSSTHATNGARRSGGSGGLERW